MDMAKDMLEDEWMDKLRDVLWLTTSKKVEYKEVGEKQKWEQHLKLGYLPQVVGRKSFMLLALLFVLQQGSDTTWCLSRRDQEIQPG